MSIPFLAPIAVPSVTGPALSMRFVRSVEVDGGGSVITTGLKGEFQVPFACEVTAWRILSVDGVSGSIAYTLKSRSYADYGTAGSAIDGGSGPAMSASTKASGSPSYTALAAGDYVSVTVDSVTSLTKVRLELTLTPIA